MLHLLHPEIFSEVVLAARGVFAYFTEECPVLVVKASAPVISAAKAKRLIKFHFAPVFCAECWSYCLLSAYLDDTVNPLLMWTPLYDDQHSKNLLNLLQQKNIIVYFIDEKNRPWLTCPGINISHKKLASFAQKITLLPTGLVESTQEEVKRQAGVWFSSTKARDDRRAFDLQLGESIYGENLTILDVTGNAMDLHGASIRHAELSYANPGKRQEPDIAEQFARLLKPNLVFLNPLKPTNKEELCDILVVGHFANYFIQLKSSPNVDSMLNRSIQRKRAKTIQHLGIAISQTEQCLRYIEVGERFYITLKSDRNFRANIQQADKSMIFIIVSQEPFEIDNAIYSKNILEFAESNRKITSYFSEAMIYDYLHYCKDEEDFFKLILEDFEILVRTRALQKPASVVPRIAALKSVCLDEIYYRSKEYNVFRD